MAGHSKWANIQHRKGRQDERRGKLFAKLARQLIVAAREGGGDPTMNPRLRTVVEEAKASEMPKDKIEYAIKRGTGEVEGANIESVIYEGYGPAGVALMVECLTENTQRSVSDVRSIMKKHGGSLGEPGCVTWMFKPTGVISLPLAAADEETLFLLAADAGAEEISAEEGAWEIHTQPEAFTAVVTALREAGLEPERAELTMLPTTLTEVPESDAPKLLKLLDELNDHDDVQRVHANLDISDEVLEKLGV